MHVLVSCLIIAWCQERSATFKHGMVTETGSQHRYNEDRGGVLLDLLAAFPQADDVRDVINHSHLMITVMFLASI